MKKILFNFLLYLTPMLLAYADIKQDRLTEMLYDDFNQFALSPRKPMTHDESLFRTMAFISAAVWTLNLYEREETPINYLIHFGIFFSISSVTALFHDKYFKKDISISREVTNSLAFLGLRLTQTLPDKVRDNLLNAIFTVYVAILSKR